MAEHRHLCSGAVLNRALRRCASAVRILNRELGISILYVTHDLTTAYQICENIIIMYRGSIVEAGTVERVIQTPKHPYSQLLVESIPQMRAVREWEQEEEEDPTFVTKVEIRTSAGCKFADRCPAVMERCWVEPPPLYRVVAEQVARCFLYEDKPVLETADVSETFVLSSAVGPDLGGSRSASVRA